uniref:Uncharacterized protein n=1 Tax=Rhizophagus irregularis (strain DAOM 181602 / DAOM 197198 / MUCL 43194) TaxID=747089 RepID=U9TX79_RHIID
MYYCKSRKGLTDSIIVRIFALMVNEVFQEKNLKMSSINRNMLYSLDSNYISELVNNEDTENLSLQNLNSNYISEELELDIDIESLSSPKFKFYNSKFRIRA